MQTTTQPHTPTERTTPVTTRLKRSAIAAQQAVEAGLQELTSAATEAAEKVGLKPKTQDELADTLIQFDADQLAVRPRWFGESHAAAERSPNQDRYLVAELDRHMKVFATTDERLLPQRATHPQGWLAIVADGAGGEAGAMASEVAVESMARFAFTAMPWLRKAADAPAPKLADSLRGAVSHSQERVIEAVRESESRGAPATTLTMAYVSWPNAYIAHVGDSRAYLLRDERLMRLTADHTYGADAERAGVDVHDELRRILINAIGGRSDDVRVELRKLSLKRGDALLLCTDGVYEALSDAELEALLIGATDAGNTPLALVVRRLLSDAHRAGGADDRTAVLGCF